MSERFKVSARGGGLPPRREDACRVGTMRRIAAARLRYCGLDSMLDDVMVVVSELLTNAIQHSGATEISLTITVEEGGVEEGGFLCVRVRDGMPGTCTAQWPADTEESGRGLLLVDALTKGQGGDWGTDDAGTETWCRLALPEATQV
jgi:signal transduction histidine kinase